MTLPVEKDISVLAGGTLIAPGMFSSPVEATGDWDNYAEAGLYRGSSTMANAPTSTLDPVFAIVQRTSTKLEQLLFYPTDIYYRSAPIASGTIGTWSAWNRQEGTGVKGEHAVVVEEISSDTTVSLDANWSTWKNKVVLFTTGAGNDFTVTIQPDAAGTWSPSTSDSGSHIIFHPMWSGGRVRIKNIAFARHDSNGRISEHSKSDTAINATEGEGEPFRFIYAPYYVGTKLYDWHVAPMVQDVENVLSAFDTTVVHEPEFDTVNHKLDHILQAEIGNATLPFWPTYTIAEVSGDSITNFSFSTFGTSAKIVGSKGDHTLYVEVTVGSDVQRDSLRDILVRENIRAGDYTDDEAFFYVVPVGDSGSETGAQLQLYVDVKSGRLKTPLPADVDITLTASSTSGGRSTYSNVYRIYGFTATTGATFTNRIGINDDAGIGGDNQLRLFGDATGIGAVRSLIEDHLGASGRAQLTFKTNADVWETYHLSAIEDTAVPTTGFNRAFNYADITVLGVPSTRQLEAAAPLRFFLSDLDVADWAAKDSDSKIPTAKLPSSGDYVFTPIAETESFYISIDSRIIKQGRTDPGSVTIDNADWPAWTLDSDAPSQYSLITVGGVNRYIQVPFVPRESSIRGFYLEAIDNNNAVLSSGYISQEIDDGTKVALVDSTGRNARPEVSLEVLDGSTPRLYTDWNRNATQKQTGFSTDDFFKLKLYEWSDAALVKSSSEDSGSRGLTGGIGVVGGFDILRRQELDAVTPTGTVINLGGTSGFSVDEGATHLEVTIRMPDDFTPTATLATWLYQDPDTDEWLNLYRPGVTASIVTLTAGRVVTFRFSEVFMHVADNGDRTVRTRLATQTDMSGSEILIVLEHEQDVNSAAVEPLTLLNVPVTVPTTTLASNLVGASFTEVGLDVPIEWDHIVSLTILLGTNKSLDPWENAVGRLVITKDELDFVGNWTSTDTLASSTDVKGWFSVGWAHAAENADMNSFRTRFSASYASTWALDAAENVPSRIVAVKREGAYLTDILVATFRQQAYIQHISCMRRL